MKKTDTPLAGPDPAGEPATGSNAPELPERSLERALGNQIRLVRRQHDLSVSDLASAAGISNGMKIVAVNGRRFSVDELRRAIADSKDATTPMEFIIDNTGYFKTVRVDYHGGLRYPHLQRAAGGADLLTGIAARRVP